MRRIFWTTLVVAMMLGCSCSEPVTHDDDNDRKEQTDDEKDIDDDGDDTSDGVKYVSSAAELKALGTIAAGDVVVWRDGTYADVVAEVKGAGTAANPVVLRAETPGGVCFTGESRITVSGSSVEVSGMWWKDPSPVSGKAVVTMAKGSSGCVLKECAITGYNTAETASVDTKWVSLYGTSNSVVGCTLHDKRNIGTLLVVWLEAGITPRHTISGNSFTRPVTLVDANNKAINGQETVRIGTSDFSMQDADCTVEGNYFYHCHGEQAEIISNKSCGNIYRGNVFVESQGTLTMRHGNNCTASGNYFFGNNMENTGGIRLIGEGHTVENNYLEGLMGSGYRTAICLVRGQQNAALSGYWQVKNAVVRNNTVVNCKYAFNVNYASSGSDQVLPVVTTRIEDNTVSLSSTSWYSVDYTASPAPDITWTDNVLFGGKQRNITLPTVTTDPVTTVTKNAAKAAADAIRNAAGCSWQTN